MKRICFVGFALAAFTSALSFAGKSAPAPAGTIYFQCAVEPAQYNLEDYIYRMNADGSGKALSPLTPDVQSFDGMPAPSMKSYGTPKRPWWIVRRLNPNAPIGIHADLYATKNGIDLIPLLLSTYNFDPVSGLEYNVSYDAPRWCNDGQDSFFTVIMERRLVDASQQQRKLLSMQLLVCRCDIRSEDLESLPADFEPLTEGDPRLRPLVVYDKPASVSGASIHFAHGGEYACSPDGSTVLVTFSLGNTAESLYSIDVSNVTDVPADFATTAEPIFTSSASYNHISAEWSPPSVAQSKLALSCGGTLYTSLPDGSSLTSLATSAYNPHWSPDGRFLVYTSVVQKGLNPDRVNIMRISSVGGTSTNLTSDLNGYLSKFAISWNP